MGEIITRPIPPIPLPFTGERLTSDYGGQTEVEHLHRYLLAREYCRHKDVLDIASGEGYGTALLGQVARSAVGIDIASDAVDHATRAYSQTTVTFVQGDACALPVPDQMVDVVVSFETIEHLDDHEQFLSELRRVMRPDGLLIISTPDRDNYSPADVPANPYHVRELTAAEFLARLHHHFEYVRMVLQRPVFGSVLLPDTASDARPLCFEKRGMDHFEASFGLARPQYLVAFASNTAATMLPASVYIDTGHLGVLSPQEAEVRLKRVSDALETERDRLSAESAARTHLEAISGKHLEQLQATQLELESLQASYSATLSEARGEARGLTSANEMSERACAVLKTELLVAGQSAAALQKRIEQQQGEIESQRHELEDHRGDVEGWRLAHDELEVRARRLGVQLDEALDRAQHYERLLTATRESHSWKATAALRLVSRLLYPRR